MAIRRRKVNLKDGTVKTRTKHGSMESQTKKGIINFGHIVSVKAYASEYAPVRGYLGDDDVVEILEVTSGRPDHLTNYYKIHYGKHQIGYVPCVLIKEVKPWENLKKFKASSTP